MSASRGDLWIPAPVVAFGLSLCATIFICAAGCDLPGRPKTGDQSVAARAERSFDALYSRHCAGCHGPLGKLGAAPPLDDKLFRSLVAEEDLRMIIASGRPGTLMPAFLEGNGGGLKAEQIAVLAQGIKSHWGQPEPVPPGTPSLRPEPGKPDREIASDAGQKVFARACASCHGEDGQGGETAGPLHVPEFVALFSDLELRRLIITGRPDLKMPGSNDADGRAPGFKPLTSREVAELVSLLASWREGAAPPVKDKGK